jgi:rRNA maturation RNase YbeY
MKIWFKNHYPRVKIRSAEMIRLAEKVLSEMGEHTAQVSLVLVGDREMRGLNRKYRGIDQPTDVLAFPMREEGKASDKNKAIDLWHPNTTLDLLGDVVISIPTARKQALLQGHSLEQEIAVLMIHGLLHLLGYDHERSVADARLMKKKEKELLQVVST